MASIDKLIKGLKAAKPSEGDSAGPVPKHDIYADASKGPFKCSNCEYYPSPNTCNEPYMVKLRGPKVEPEACCDLFEAR